MNKIKVLYDVVKTMREKDTFKGELKVEAEKDKTVVLDFTKEFEVNTSKGDGIFKISVSADCCGNKAQHESTTEFSFKDGCSHKGMWKKIHQHHCKGFNGGVKGCLDRVAFALNLLNNMNLEEKEDKTVLTLDLKKLCGEICPEGCMDFCGETEDKCCCGYDCCKEFINCDYNDAELTLWINKNSEVEKVEVTANASDRSIKALLKLNW